MVMINAIFWKNSHRPPGSIRPSRRPSRPAPVRRAAVSIGRRVAARRVCDT
jgi:hypothetical protein